MGISVRLDSEIESELEKTARLLHMTKSNIIKLSLKEFCYGIKKEKEKSPYELIKDLLDKEGSGRGNLSVQGEDILREAFRRKG
jgi:predicted transcriptional regulator